MNNKFLEYLKNNSPEVTVTKNGIKIRKFFNPLIRMVAPEGHYKLHVESKATMPKETRIIYAPTHAFKDDLLYTILTIKDHGYVLFGSLPQFFHTFDGINAWLNGVILVDRTNKESRKASKLKMQRAISFGSNIIMFPEGVWNKTQNLLALKLFPGIYDTAKKTNALVAVVANHIEGDNCYTILDEAFDITQYSQEEGLEILREKMCTLKWQLMEKYSKASHNDLISDKTRDEQWADHIDELIAQVKFYDYEVENNAHYKKKNEIDAKEVFSVLDDVPVTKENAYVLKMTKNKC